MKKLPIFFIAVLALVPGRHGAAVPKLDIEPKSRSNVVLIDTSLGKIKVRLLPDKAPITVKNFLQYADDRFYDGTVFHRVIPNFMIQGGGMVRGMQEKKGRDPIKNEASNALSNKRGTIAVARAQDPNSGTSQFYINVKDNEYLDQSTARNQPGYCVFGEVIDGMEVADAISRVNTNAQAGHQNVPIEDIVIKSIRRDK